MSDEVYRIAKSLGRIQSQLRKELLDELSQSEDDLEFLFDPHSYSLKLEELRDKYVTRLFVLQHIAQELSHLSAHPRKRQTRVTTLIADDHQSLTKLVNSRLARMDNCRVLDIKFSPVPDSGWLAVITYVAGAMPPDAEETARWT
ncbi:MAG TPA: hypothetical protein PL033_11270 [Candidatus Brocadiia bacterium]|nr:hypothetical protein [Candidatus Brocadiia bacterium]